MDDKKNEESDPWAGIEADVPSQGFETINIPSFEDLVPSDSEPLSAHADALPEFENINPKDFDEVNLDFGDLMIDSVEESSTQSVSNVSLSAQNNEDGEAPVHEHAANVEVFGKGDAETYAENEKSKEDGNSFNEENNAVDATAIVDPTEITEQMDFPSVVESLGETVADPWQGITQEMPSEPESAGFFGVNESKSEMPFANVSGVYDFSDTAMQSTPLQPPSDEPWNDSAPTDTSAWHLPEEMAAETNESLGNLVDSESDPADAWENDVDDPAIADLLEDVGDESLPVEKAWDSQPQDSFETLSESSPMLSNKDPFSGGNLEENVFDSDVDPHANDEHNSQQSESVDAGIVSEFPFSDDSSSAEEPWQESGSESAGFGIEGESIEAGIFPFAADTSSETSQGIDIQTSLDGEAVVAIAGSLEASRESSKKKSKSPLHDGKKSKKSGGLGQIMGVFGGGLLSIPIVLAILIFGLKQDPLKIAPSMAKWPVVGGLVPQKFQPGAKGSTKLPSGPSLDDLGSIGSQTTPLPTNEPEPSNDLSQDSEVMPSDEETETPPDDATANSLAGIGADVKDSLGLSEETNKPEEMKDEIAQEDGPFSPDPPTDEMPEDLAVVETQIVEPAEPEPLDTSAVFDAVQAASDSRDALMAIESTLKDSNGILDEDAISSEDKTARKNLMKGWYKNLATLGEELTQLEVRAAETGRPLEMLPDVVTNELANIVRDVQTTGHLEKLGCMWMSVQNAKRPANGAVILGTLVSTRQVGPYWFTKLKISEDDTVSLLNIVSKRMPDASAGDKIFMLGVVFEGNSDGPATLWAAAIQPVVSIAEFADRETNSVEDEVMEPSEKDDSRIDEAPLDLKQPTETDEVMVDQETETVSEPPLEEMPGENELEPLDENSDASLEEMPEEPAEDSPTTVDDSEAEEKISEKESLTEDDLELPAPATLPVSESEPEKTN